MIQLFKCAQNGLQKLIQTYKTNPVLGIVFYHFVALIDNHLDEQDRGIDRLFFKRDCMSSFYTDEIIHKFQTLWPPDKIAIVLDLVTYIVKSSSNVSALETIMVEADGRVGSLV